MKPGAVFIMSPGFVFQPAFTGWRGSRAPHPENTMTPEQANDILSGEWPKKVAQEAFRFSLKKDPREPRRFGSPANGPIKEYLQSKDLESLEHDKTYLTEMTELCVPLKLRAPIHTRWKPDQPKFTDIRLHLRRAKIDINTLHPQIRTLAQGKQPNENLLEFFVNVDLINTLHAIGVPGVCIETQSGYAYPTLCIAEYADWTWRSIRVIYAGHNVIADSQVTHETLKGSHTFARVNGGWCRL